MEGAGVVAEGGDGETEAEGVMITNMTRTSVVVQTSTMQGGVITILFTTLRGLMNMVADIVMNMDTVIEMDTRIQDRARSMGGAMLVLISENRV